MAEPTRATRTDAVPNHGRSKRDRVGEVLLPVRLSEAVFLRWRSWGDDARAHQVRASTPHLSRGLPASIIYPVGAPGVFGGGLPSRWPVWIWNDIGFNRHAGLRRLRRPSHLIGRANGRLVAACAAASARGGRKGQSSNGPATASRGRSRDTNIAALRGLRRAHLWARLVRVQPGLGPRNIPGTRRLRGHSFDS